MIANEFGVDDDSERVVDLPPTTVVAAKRQQQSTVSGLTRVQDIQTVEAEILPLAEVALTNQGLPIVEGQNKSRGRGCGRSWKNYVIGGLLGGVAALSFALVWSESPCSADDTYAQLICEHLNRVNLSGERVRFPLPKHGPSAEEMALDWVIQQALSQTTVTFERLPQRFALASFFFHNQALFDTPFYCPQGKDWKIDAADECDWFEGAVGCSAAKGVTAFRVGWETESDGPVLAFPLRCFVGSLPSNLALLSSLTMLSLNGQDFQQSTIPESFYKLTSLDTLSLGYSSISGTLSPAVNNLANLQVLDLSRNLLQGNIPQMDSLLNMREVRLDDNSLSGTIPTSIMSFAMVSKVLLNHNQLVGSIPTVVGEMTKLTHLELQGNMLTGQIPVSLLGLQNLTVFRAFNNRLEGGDEYPICSSNQTFESLSLDCDRVPCPCCTGCCLPNDEDRLVCTSSTCALCQGLFDCDPMENFDGSWRGKALTCSCVCRA